MALTRAQKFRIKEGMNILTVNAPSDCITQIRSLSKGLKVSAAIKEYQQIHWFIKNKSEMEQELNRVLSLLEEGVICWIYFPKGSSKIQTDLTRDKGWENLLQHDELQWISLLSFDETWSAFGMRLQNEKDKKKLAQPRPIFDYIDAVAKTVRLPNDLGLALKKSKKASTFYENLSFTNRKEYVEWILTAKREETRKERIKETIKKLEKNWKNPRNI